MENHRKKIEKVLGYVLGLTNQAYQQLIEFDDFRIEMMLKDVKYVFKCPRETEHFPASQFDDNRGYPT